jgi:uncharacterized repeat protein (TIGR02543 family)
VVLYINDKANEYTITYNANGGSGAPEALTADYGSTVQISSTVPTRSGYAFLGWATSSTATSAAYTAGQEITMPKDGLVLYAVWEYSCISNSTDSNGDTYYLPAGFTYVEGTVDTGLVIEDSNGNQFVWVPVVATGLEYSKLTGSYTTGVTAEQTTDDTLPSGIASEQAQITKYGGFYIARYEAGIPSNLTTAINTASASARNVTAVPVSKQNQVPWNYIDYDHAKTNAESMYSNDVVQSGLLTGTQWDVVMKWLESSGYNVKTDSSAFGNYYNTSWETSAMSSDNEATWSAGRKAARTDALFKTGSAATVSNNIYDMAGNVWEWTNEIYSTNRVARGGYFYSVSGGSPAASRNNTSTTYTRNAFGFRVVLYIK